MTTTIASILLSFAVLFFAARPGYSACFVVSGDKTTDFDGKSLSGLLVEKSSLIELDKEFPSLNAVEKTFTGDVQTCTTCVEKHVRCDSSQKGK